MFGLVDRNKRVLLNHISRSIPIKSTKLPRLSKVISLVQSLHAPQVNAKGKSRVCYDNHNKTRSERLQTVRATLAFNAF